MDIARAVLMDLRAEITFVMAAGSFVRVQRRAAFGRAWHKIEAAGRYLNLFVFLLAVVFWKTTPGDTVSSGLRHLRCAAQVVFTKGPSPQL